MHATTSVLTLLPLLPLSLATPTPSTTQNPPHLDLTVYRGTSSDPCTNTKGGWAVHLPVDPTTCYSWPNDHGITCVKRLMKTTPGGTEANLDAQPIECDMMGYIDAPDCSGNETLRAIREVNQTWTWDQKLGYMDVTSFKVNCTGFG